MKNIRLAYLVLLTGLALVSLFSDRVLSRPYEFRTFQLSMINLTGILAIGCMSAGMFLATRPTSLEPSLGGLDKTYRLHRHVGSSNGTGAGCPHSTLNVHRGSRGSLDRQSAKGTAR